MAVSTVVTGVYMGRVKEYFSVSGYHTNFGLRAIVTLNMVSLGSTPEPTETDSLDMRFGADQDRLVGEVDDDLGNSKSFHVRLPWEWFDTFWRAISDQNCELSILWNENKEIIDIGARVSEGFEGPANQERRERIEAMRREG